jgi:hypothetical protein
MFKPYTKEMQTGVQAGTREADELLAKAFKRKGNRKTASNRGNAPTEYGGRTYHSKLEADYARELDMRIMAKDVKEWKPQVRLDLRVNGEHVTFYAMDFVVTHPDGQIELVEVKGREENLWFNKWKLTKALLPKGEIPGVPKNAWLTLVKAGKNGRFVSQIQVLNYK